jgi:exopolyphosphatase/pppGpp-phosphohydrolase
MNHYVIDVGSRSIKLHRQSGKDVSLTAIRNWDPINDARDAERLDQLLAHLITEADRAASIRAIGTAAARRNPELAAAIGIACERRGLPYETISQAREADLIRRAIGSRRQLDIINTGGGSIQIVHAKGGTELIEFGISDLNAMFGLGRAPEHRRINAAKRFLADGLPAGLRRFVYTGGEKRYLQSLGIRLDPRGFCRADDFRALARRLETLTQDELDRLSPFDTGWMSGAIASNLIVEACLDLSGADRFLPSDLNIADGVIAGLAGAGSTGGRTHG